MTRDSVSTARASIQPTPGGWRALFRSDDDGQTWRQASNFQQTNLGDGDGQYYFAMAAVPDEPNRVVVRGTTQGYWVTFDPSIATRNDSWQSLEYSPSPHPNARDFAFTAPTAEVPSLLLEADNGGLYGLFFRWTSLSNGLATTEMVSIAYDANSRTLFGGTYDNGVIAQDPSVLNQWYEVAGGHGGTVAVDSSGENSLRYLLADNMRSFQRSHLDEFGNPVTEPVRLADPATPLIAQRLIGGRS